MRIKLEEALRQTEERFHTIFNKAMDGILVADAKTGMFFMANPSMCRFLGYRNEEILRLGVSDIHPKEHLPEELGRFMALAKGAIAIVENVPCLRKDGSVVFADITGGPIELGGRKYNLGFFRDVTRRKRGEEELSLKNALLDAQKEASSEGILAVDTVGKVIFHNARFREIWKIPPAILKTGDRHRIALFSSTQLKNPKAFLKMAERLFKGTETRRHDLLEFRDGRVVSRYSSPLKGKRGDLLGRICFFRDITHEIEIDRAKSQFISVASHELRSPLDGVRWLLESILRRGSLTSHQAEFIRKALESNQRIINLSNDLLDATRLEMGPPLSAPIRTDLAGFLEKLIEEVQPNAKANHQTFRYIRPAGPLFVSLDQPLHSQAISNVFSNAIRYSSKNTTITVTLSSNGQGAEIQVEDQGMKTDDRMKISEYLLKGRAEVHCQVPGFGLGLYLAQRILSLCGGTLDIKSRPGKGSVATIRIPHSKVSIQENE